MVAADGAQARAILGRRAGGLHDQGAALVAGHLGGRARRMEETPLRAELRRAEIVGQRDAMRHRLAAARHRDGARHIVAGGFHPAVVGPLDRLQQRLASEVVVAVFVGVVDEVPLLAVGALDERGMAARPPFLRGGGGAHDGVVGRVFPRAVDALRARHDHHVAGRRAGRAALREHHVVVVAAAHDLRAFLGKRLHFPVLGVFPTVVDLLHGAGDAEAVVRQRRIGSTTEEDVAFSVRADGVPRIDAADLQVDRLAPRSANVVGIHHHVGEAGRAERRKIDVETPVVVREIGRPDVADVAVECRADRLPVHQIARVPDQKAGHALERRVDHVVVRAALEHRGIGTVAGEDRV